MLTQIHTHSIHAWVHACKRSKLTADTVSPTPTWWSCSQLEDYTYLVVVHSYLVVVLVYSLDTYLVVVHSCGGLHALELRLHSTMRLLRQHLRYILGVHRADLFKINWGRGVRRGWGG
jgi:hypothetical protein